MNKQKGQMYPWVTHTSTHLGGKCPHECEYCSIQDLQRRFPEQLPYSGRLFLKEKELAVNYGAGKIIFIENCNDLFSEGVPEQWIEQILAHCKEFENNTYVFQTKNPYRIVQILRKNRNMFPNESLIGCTIETNRENNIGNAPARLVRMGAMSSLDSVYNFNTFITIEPIMDFDVELLVNWIAIANPRFVNIGADSKNHGLPEPSAEKVSMLIDGINALGIQIREKHNLERLMK